MGVSKRTKNSADRRESRQWPSLSIFAYFGCLDLGLTGLSRIYFVATLSPDLLMFVESEKFYP